jgi:sigma-B regulation protein RsbU (phosphoserine phosphatase)
MHRLERYVRANFHPDHFLTFLAGKLDAASGVLRWCNAGHLLPVVVTPTGVVRFLEGGDPAFNILPWQEFQCFEYRLEPGDLLCVYTDGLVEASRDGKGQFGDERLVECLRQHREHGLPLLRRGVFAAVESFSEGNGAEDDKSIILVRRVDRASRWSSPGRAP